MLRHCPGGCPCPHHSGKPVARRKHKSAAGMESGPQRLSSRVPREPITDYFCQQSRAPTLPSPITHSCTVARKGQGRTGLPGPQSSPGGKGQNPSFATCLPALPPCRPILCPPSSQEQHAVVHWRQLKWRCPCADGAGSDTGTQTTGH